MRQPAEHGHDERLAGGPAADTRHRHKRQVAPSDLLQSSDQFSTIKKVFLVKTDVLWIEEIDFVTRSKDKDLFYGFLEQLDQYQGHGLIIATTSKL